MERQHLMQGIIKRLSILRVQVEACGKLNLTDINVLSENFYRDLLNLILSRQLTNINIVKANAAAIDLGDEIAKIAIQVTSTKTKTKTAATVDSFISKGLHKKYDRLIILNISKKANHHAAQVGEAGVYELDTKKDIWDANDLIKMINDLPTAKIMEVAAFLETEVALGKTESIPKEVRTFIELIEKLSDESRQPEAAPFLEYPDPNGKITKRFAEHAEFLKQEFQELYAEYGQSLDEVSRSVHLGQTRIRRLNIYLRNFSDKVLTDCSGNAPLALSKLVEHFAHKISGLGIEHNETAILFFLIDQLIKCNVFPNREMADA